MATNCVHMHKIILNYQSICLKLQTLQLHVESTAFILQLYLGHPSRAHNRDGLAYQILLTQAHSKYH